jgi:hypothetical protein
MSAYELRFPDTAFALRQKEPRKENPRHLAFVRMLPCAICGTYGVDPAHLRTGNRALKKPETGMGEKPSDMWTIPLCRSHHDEQHTGNETAFWQGKGINPFTLCMDLYEATGDEERALAVLRSHRPIPLYRASTGTTEDTGAGE